MHIFTLILLLWISSGVLMAQGNRPFSYKDDKELFERVVRVEEGLLNVQKNIELLMQQTDKRLENMQHNIDKRLEQVDKRLENMQSNIDKRFNTLYWILGIVFLVILGAFGFLFKMVYDNGKRIAHNSSKLDFLCGQKKLQKDEPDREVMYN